MEAVLILTTLAEFDHFSLVNLSWLKCCFGNTLGYCIAVALQNAPDSTLMYNFTMWE